MLTWLGLPSSSAQWGAWLSMSLGGLLGWLFSPRVWIATLGPWRWWSMLSGSAAQESFYTADAQGDEGNSWGILQFGSGAWESATGNTPTFDTGTDARLSPFRSGYAAARYVNAGLKTTWRWYPKLMCPVLGFAAMRMMWTGGLSESIASRPYFSTERVDSGAAVGMFTRAVEEGDRQQGPTLGYTAFLSWRVITLPLTIWTARCLVKLRRK